MQFVHQTLTWGFLLALIPLLIHLINLVRRRRVQWAAMDFLLQSYRRHRTWIWLQQLLLLFLRMAAIAIVVAMLAQWVTQREWFALFGSATTHHYILLDDSYSMGARFGGTSSFDVAEQAIVNLGSQVMRQETGQKVTLIRYSRAASASPDLSAGQVADLNSEIVDSDFDVFVSDKLRQFQVSELALGPQAGLEIVSQLLDVGLEEQNVFYLLSDFRQKDWAAPAEIRQRLEQIAQRGTEIHLVDCADETPGHLALVDVRPADDTRAAGVPLFIDILVKNYGRQTARQVPVQLRTYFHDPALQAASEPGADAARVDTPPAALLQEIAAGETAAARVQVFFPQPGSHVVEAVLPEDALAADNRRWCVVDLPESEPVLIVDGSLDQRHDYYVSAAFAPGERAATGIRPESKPVAFLRDASLETLRAYRAIYLLDVPRLDNAAVKHLEQYVAQGGGLAIFAGENVNTDFYNASLFREGEGLLPVKLDREVALPAERFENTPDLEVSSHPIFSVLLGERNPFIRLVTVERFLRIAEETAQDQPQVLARLRSGDPLAVEGRVGDGRVIVFLTTAAPVWNNWANDPSFVVMMLKLQSYLAAPARSSDARLVGSEVRVELDATQFAPETSFVLPQGEEPAGQLVVSRSAAPAAGDGTLLAQLGDSRALSPETSRSGIYEAWLQPLSGPRVVRRYALNVDPAEGQLTRSARRALRDRLEPVDVVIHQADEIGYDFLERAGSNRSLFLMALLVGALFGEQLLAFFTSYHPARGGSG